MKNSYVSIGSTLPVFFKLLGKNRFRIHPRYLFRMFMVFQSAVWSSVFKIIEKFKYDRKINMLPTPEKPVFIIGHWRTGSTFLHQLMTLDDRFVTPNVFQVTVPDCFISIEKYYKPVMRRLMDNKRPMDNVRFGPDAPQEDEFALFRLTLKSPLNKVVFPEKSGYFLTNDKNFSNAQDQTKKWEKAIFYFYKKLIFRNDKRILIKNPFHSMRLRTLMRLFPDAVFIHIFRNPLDVVPSTIRMWDIIGRQNCMNSNWEKPSTSDVVNLYKSMLQRIQNDLAEIEQTRYAEVKYEELEIDPLKTIRRIYSHFKLELTSELEQKIQEFLLEEKNFQKNVHALSHEDKEIIMYEMNEFMMQKGYLLTQSAEVH